METPGPDTRLVRRRRRPRLATSWTSCQSVTSGGWLVVMSDVLVVFSHCFRPSATSTATATAEKGVKVGLGLERERLRVGETGKVLETHLVEVVPTVKVANPIGAKKLVRSQPEVPRPKTVLPTSRTNSSDDSLVPVIPEVERPELQQRPGEVPSEPSYQENLVASGCQ